MATHPPQPIAPTSLASLEAGLARLAQTFLPLAKKIEPAAYTDVELTQAKAYLVFAHAELEDYFETACRAKAQRTFDAVCAGDVNLAAMSLLSHYGEKMSIVTELAKFKDRHTELVKDFKQPGLTVTRALLEKFSKALSAFTEQCRKNNGVKEANLLPMILPLGINPLTIDPTWLAELNAFGVDRGAHAHRSLSAVQQIADPFVAPEQIRRILEGPPGAAPPAGSSIKIHSLRSLDALLAL